MKPIIEVNHLAKKYKYGDSQPYYTLRDSLTNFVKKPFGISKKQDILAKGEFWALKDISFKLNQGEVLGIIGPNGSGKSTLLKILSRITSPTKGEAILRGRIESLLEVGTGFHPELTGRENIYLNGAILGMTRREISSKFDEIVDFAGVDKFLNTPVKHFSSGMYMRLAFAIAANLEPEILLVDEVLAVGDLEFQNKCLGKMREISKHEGRTIIFVSHNMVSILNLCQRAILLDKGTLIAAGKVDEVVNRYVHETNKKQSLIMKDRVERIGDHKAYVTKIKILNNKGVETSNIGMGEEFTIELEIEGDLNKAIVGILIGSDYINQIVRAYSWESYDGNINIHNPFRIQCKFENIPIMHGDYSIHTWIGRPAELSDYVENAAKITFLPQDIFGTGRVLDKNGGIFYCKHQWKILK